MKEVTAHLQKAIFLKVEKVPKDLRAEIEKDNTFMFYDDKACSKCEWFQSGQRHCDVCDECAAFKGGAELVQPVKIKDKKYLSIPMGYQKKLKGKARAYGVDIKFKSHFPRDAKMSRRVKFTGTLYPHQLKACEEMMGQKRGILEAPPRSGKTVMGTAMACDLGYKTLIIASQRDWLIGFKETFVGSNSQKPLTNIKESKIGIATKLKHFQDYDVALATVQTFWSEKGRKLLKKISKMFNVVIVDEVHTGAAPKFAYVLSQVKAEYRFGLSGTPDRKDGKMILVDHIFGGVVYRVKVDMHRPHIRLVRTEYVNKSKQGLWAHLVSHLEKDPKRLKLIAKWALRDVKEGHMVMIPMTRVVVVRALVQAINKMAGKTIAVAFTGQTKKAMRDEYIQRARKYKVKVMVGQFRLLSTGINIPRASALYEVSMSSNVPQAVQRFSRVLTPYEGKPVPIVRYFLDNSQVRRNCMRNEWFQAMVPRFKPVVSEKDMEVLKGYFSGRDQERITF